MAKQAKFAFCLFEYIPFGGMQRDLLHIAETCLKRGHQVDIFAGAWKAPLPVHLNVSILPVSGLANHRRCESFAKRLGEYLSKNIKEYDAVVGFNKMPGLDIYFAADTCFAARARSRTFWYRLNGRCRSYLRLEQAVFDKNAKTEILLISEQQKEFYKDYYGTSEKRFHLLPPGISRDRPATGNSGEAGRGLRSELGIGSDQNLVLMVGSGFKTKGVDRGIRAISSLPSRLREKTILLVVGEGNKRPFRRLARRAGVDKQVYFVGGRKDVPRFMAAADLLLHPSYRETAGMVLIEAMASGLPVLATDVCGYGFHIERAGAGMLVPSPFDQKILNQLLSSMLISDMKNKWHKNGMRYVADTDVFSLPEKAADFIERVAAC